MSKEKTRRPLKAARKAKVVASGVPCGALILAIGCAIRLGYAAVECFARVGKAVPARVPTSGKVFAGVWSDSLCAETRTNKSPANVITTATGYN